MEEGTCVVGGEGGGGTIQYCSQRQGHSGVRSALATETFFAAGLGAAGLGAAGLGAGFAAGFGGGGGLGAAGGLACMNERGRERKSEGRNLEGLQMKRRRKARVT